MNEEEGDENGWTIRFQEVDPKGEQEMEEKEPENIDDDGVEEEPSVIVDEEALAEEENGDEDDENTDDRRVSADTEQEGDEGERNLFKRARLLIGAICIIAALTAIVWKAVEDGSSNTSASDAASDEGNLTAKEKESAPAKQQAGADAPHSCTRLNDVSFNLGKKEYAFRVYNCEGFDRSLVDPEATEGQKPSFDRLTPFDVVLAELR